MKRKFILSVFFFSFLMISNTHAQNSTQLSITGQVIDKQLNKPVEYASIAIVDSTGANILGGTISDKNGKFQLKVKDESNYQLKIQFVGYKDYVQKNLSFKKKNNDLGKIRLSQKVEELEGVEVVSLMNEVSYGVDKQIINVKNTITNDGGNAADALQNAPSVVVDAEGNVLLRGNSNFKLLIDGKPTIVNASDLLQNMPASSIDRIEIITNPSVKFDPDGVSGIINLILKKQFNVGFNGQLNYTVMTGNKHRGSVQLNLRKKKVNAFLGFRYNDKPEQTNNGTYREFIELDTVYKDNLVAIRNIRRTSAEINMGLDFDIDSLSYISMQTKLGQWSFQRAISSDLVYETVPNSIYQIFKLDENFLTSNRYVNADLSYKRKLQNNKGELIFNGFYTHLINETPNELSEVQIDANDLEIGQKSFQKIRNNNERDHFRFKLDYKLNVSKTLTIESGLQSDLNSSKNNYTLSTKEGEGIWVQDEELSGDFYFNRNIHSIYLQGNSKVKKFNFQPGIRAEYVDRSFNSDNSNLDYNKINLFPSVHFSYNMEKKGMINLSYSKRINRPTEWQLNPKPYSTDRFLVRKGNENLKPDLTHSFDLNHNFRTKKISLNTNLYFRQTNNPISTVLINENQQFIDLYANIDKSISSGLELMTNVNAMSWLRMNVSGAVYYQQYSIDISNVLVNNSGSITGNGRFTSTFVLNKKTFLQFMAIYYAPNVMPQGKISDFYYFDFILRRSFLNRRLNASIRTHNTFNTGKFVYSSNGENFNSESWHKYEGPVLLFSVSYSLNKFKAKQLKNNVNMNFDSGMDL